MIKTASLRLQRKLYTTFLEIQIRLITVIERIGFVNYEYDSGIKSTTYFVLFFTDYISSVIKNGRKYFTIIIKFLSHQPFVNIAT